LRANKRWNRAITFLFAEPRTRDSKRLVGGASGGTRVKLCFGIRVFATWLIDRVSRTLVVSSRDGLLAAIVKTRPGTRSCARKNLKRLKDYKSEPREPRVCRSLAIIYEFGAPKKATDRGRSAASLSEVRSTDFKSIRGSDKIFYGERCLFNGPYGGRGLLTSALICSQRGPYRLSLESLRSLRCTLADHDIAICEGPCERGSRDFRISSLRTSR